MGTVLTLDGTLVAAPSQVSDQTFPTGTDSIPFTLTPSQKQVTVDTGPMRPIVASPNAFVALPGIGAAGPVTQGLTFYFRCASSFLVELTTAVPSNPDRVSVVPAYGLLILEFPPDQYLKGVRVQGAGQLEYYAGGNL